MVDQKSIDWLKRRHDEIMACEAAALNALAQGDKNAYDADMKRKARLLADLAADYNKYMSGLPDRKVEARLEQFSTSAATALELGSIFYMSALLYRDDHKKGEPDNLDVFIRDLEAGK